MKRSWVVITLGVVAGVAGGLLALVLGWITIWNCSSGDGGVPYVSPESPQADVCSATGDGVILLVLGLAAAVGLAIAAIAVGRAWIRGSRPWVLFAFLAACAVIAPIALTWAYNSPSNECTGEAAEAYEAWSDAGGKGEPPYDCLTY